MLFFESDNWIVGWKTCWRSDPLWVIFDCFPTSGMLNRRDVDIMEYRTDGNFYLKPMKCCTSGSQTSGGTHCNYDYRSSCPKAFYSKELFLKMSQILPKDMYKVNKKNKGFKYEKENFWIIRVSLWVLQNILRTPAM